MPKAYPRDWNECITFKQQVVWYLRKHDRLEIDTSLILKVKWDLEKEGMRNDWWSWITGNTESEITPKQVFDRLMEMFPEKINYNTRRELTDEEFLRVF